MFSYAPSVPQSKLFGRDCDRTTWKELTTVNSMNKKRIETFESAIKCCKTREDMLKLADLLSKGLLKADMLVLSENSPLIKAFFQNQEYEEPWRRRFDRFEHGNIFTAEARAGKYSSAEKIIGHCLAKYLDAWVCKEEAHTPEAREIANKAKEYGIDVDYILEVYAPPAELCRATSVCAPGSGQTKAA